MNRGWRRVRRWLPKILRPSTTWSTSGCGERPLLVAVVHANGATNVASYQGIPHIDAVALLHSLAERLEQQMLAGCPSTEEVR